MTIAGINITQMLLNIARYLDYYRQKRTGEEALQVQKLYMQAMMDIVNLFTDQANAQWEEATRTLEENKKCDGEIENMQLYLAELLEPLPEPEDEDGMNKIQFRCAAAIRISRQVGEELRK